MSAQADESTEAFDDGISLQSTPQKTNALSNKVSSVLSASYADPEIRDALRHLDERKFQNTASSRRVLLLELQKEVTQRNGDIIKDFGQVAEVRPLPLT